MFWKMLSWKKIEDVKNPEIERFHFCPIESCDARNKLGGLQWSVTLRTIL